MNLLTGALLLISVISMATYFASLISLASLPHNKGIVRTSVCRVVASFCYIVISIATIAHNPDSRAISIGVFVAVQLMWQANSVADVLLTRRGNKKVGGGG